MYLSFPKTIMPMHNNLQTAFDALDKGYTPIPVLPGQKIPAVRWKHWQHEKPNRETIRSWFHETRNNIALICKGFLTVDVDDPNLLDFVIEKAGKSPSIRQTPNSGGYQIDYRIRKGVEYANRVRIRNQDIDLRAPGRGYVLIPPSENEAGVPYRWVGEAKELIPIESLPVFRVSWTRERSRRQMKQIAVHDCDLDERERRALVYVSHIEGAIAGQRGHDRTMRVAGVLIQKFRLDFESAMRIFQMWNDTCEPPWSEQDLMHKLQSAIKNLPKYS